MRLLLIMAFVGLLSACGQQISIEQDYQQSYDFSAASTYQFLAIDEKSYTSLNKNRLENALKQNLADKGFTLTDNDTSELIVAFTIYQQEKQRQRVTTTGFDNSYHGHNYFGPSINFGTSYVDNIDYKVGNLIIDIIDRKTRQVVYHSVASSEIISSLTPDEREQLIQSSVEKALENFPPQKP